MATLDQPLVIALEENARDAYMAGIEILLRLLDNIIREPQNVKYRTVRMENLTIKEKLLSVAGMKALMLEMGFVESEGTLTLPSNVLLAKLRKYRDFIAERKGTMQDDTLAVDAGGGPNLAICTAAPELKSKSTIRASKSFQARTTFPRVLQTDNTLIRQLELLSDQVMQYEDEELIDSGRSLIPLDMLRSRAKDNMLRILKHIKDGKVKDGDTEEPCLLDLLLQELTEWFRASFFRWINALPCTNCGNEKTQLSHSTVEDGVRVEIYKCCNELRRFYRYNDIEKLLHTRSGRCGEWANCFTFLCRCIGFDARFVYSTGDHVWTEVWSVRQKRWVHVDPCESVIDSPLMYEHGWRKPITYVFAFSRDDVQDVTWRYTNDHKKVLSARKSCTEPELLAAIMKLRTKRRENGSPEWLAFLRKRTFDECITLLATRPPTQAELEGRTSGSLDWRLQRGEQQLNTFYIFIPNEQEKAAMQFNVRYSSGRDAYERFIKVPTGDSVIESSKGWESRQYASENLFRKEEHDWKMVYLARTENTNEGKIEWKFDFAIQGLAVKDIQLRFNTQTYEGGKVELCYLKEDGAQLASLQSLRGIGKFTIRARLSGGKMWQHAQIFRQPTKATDCGFELNVTFM